ncbi:MAG: hypothetical protein QF915_05935 [Candidatus Woesearchaeota archaeon]|nr:hypothetical protein [Candidatus Woesearchaeota archaeon]MDP7457895.1 hypothetical protein [Candidatus Woesearchaeota archaeon]
MKKKFYKILIIILVLALLLLYLRYTLSTNHLDDLLVNANVYSEQLEHISGLGLLDSQHIHSDFKVFIKGEEINFTYEELQAPEWGSVQFWRESGFSRFVYMHGGEDNDNVIHVHATGITLGMFFRVIGGSLNYSCLTLPEVMVELNQESTYCSNTDDLLLVYANGRKIQNPNSYLFNDLDRILISYGKVKDTRTQLPLIGYKACIHSENC